MPANVDQMFSVREMPWHGEGYVPDDYPQDWDEARKWAGLEWEPESAPVVLPADPGELRKVFATHLFNAEMTDQQRLDALVASATAAEARLGGWQRVTRSDTGTTLAVTKSTYAIINHSAFGEIFEAVLHQSGNLKAETGGCLEGGRKVWMLVKLDEPIILPGDSSPTMPYLAITSRHDSEGGATLRATAVRIVCANTFGAAEMEGQRTGAAFTFRHTANWRDRIAEAEKAVTSARADLKAYSDLATELLGIPVTPEQRELFVVSFIPDPPAGLTTDRVKGNIADARMALRSVIGSETVTGAGIEGTAYGLVQAAGEYLDHVRRARSWETRLNRSLLRPEPLKASAVSLAREVAKA